MEATPLETGVAPAGGGGEGRSALSSHSPSAPDLAPSLAAASAAAAAGPGQAGNCSSNDADSHAQAGSGNYYYLPGGSGDPSDGVGCSPARSLPQSPAQFSAQFPGGNGNNSGESGNGEGRKGEKRNSRLSTPPLSPSKRRHHNVRSSAASKSPALHPADGRHSAGCAASTSAAPSETPCVSAGSAAPSSAASSETPSDTSSSAPGHASRIGGGNEATKNFAPPDVKTGPYHPSLKKLNDAQFEFLEKMLELGILSKDEATPLWNLFHWEWGNINPKAAYIVVLLLNYQTKEQARGLKDFHSSAALRSNGERIEKAWRHQAGAVGEENFVQTIHGDVFPLSYEHESSIEAEVGKKNAKTVMYWWDKIVLSVLRNDDTFKIAFCSQSAVKSYAKHVYGKVDKDGEGDPSVMDEIHREHEGKYLSLAKHELAVGDHPCRIYRKGPSYRRGRRASCSKTDRFQTVVKRVISGDPDAVCTYYTDIFVDNGEEESTVDILIDHHDDQSFVSAATTHEAITAYFSRNAAKIYKRNGLADRSEARVYMCFEFMCHNGGTAYAEHRALAKALLPVGNDPGKLVCEKMRELYKRIRRKPWFKSDAAFLACMKNHQCSLQERVESGEKLTPVEEKMRVSYQKDAERKRKWRQSGSEANKAARKAKDAERKSDKWSKMSEAEKKARREKNAEAARKYRQRKKDALVAGR